MQSILRDRQIEYLVHFTTESNLQKILEQGVLPVNDPNYQGERIDQSRADNKGNCSFFSISFPNYKMFFARRQNPDFENWLVLGIDARILLENRTAFCCFTNAAKNSGRHIRLLTKETLEDLFYQTKEYPDGNIRCRQDIPLNYTTDPQAEILIEGTILPEHIRVLWHDNCYNNKPLVLRSGHQINVKNNPNLFKPRKDYQYWKN